MILHLAKIGNDVPTKDYKGYGSYGVIGTDTGVKDCNGEAIYVGCMVKVTKGAGNWWSNIVCEFDRGVNGKYFGVMGMASINLELVSSCNKVEVVMPYSYLNIEFRKHINFISLGADYMEESYDWVDGELVQTRNFREL